MKIQFQFGLIFVLFCLMIASPSFAGPWYLGLKGGTMIADSGEMDNAFNGGLLLGRDLLNFANGIVAVEAEATTTIPRGDISTPSFPNGKWDINSAALWLAYRSQELFKFFYLKGKIGLEYTDIGIEKAGDSRSYSDTSFSFGIGAGWQITELYSLELEYVPSLTSYEFVGTEGDISFLSLCLNFRF